VKTKKQQSPLSFLAKIVLVAVVSLTAGISHAGNAKSVVRVTVQVVGSCGVGENGQILRCNSEAKPQLLTAIDPVSGEKINVINL